MLVEAIFWFHPLVWWIGSKLVEERERACDEEVVRLGSDPEVYAETILKICKVYLASPLPCAAGISGANLRKRIESIMDNPFLNSLSIGKKILLGAVGCLVLVTPITVGILGAPAVRAQSTQSKPPAAVSPVTTAADKAPQPELSAQAVSPTQGNPPNMAFQPGSASGPAFTAADVHVSSEPPDQNPRGGFYAGGLYEIRSVTVVELIMTAYGVARNKVVGGPNWLGTGRFDVIARAPADATPATQQLMLQTLLADRFKLVVHPDTRPLPAFALTVRNGGPQMKPASGSGESGCRQQPPNGPAAEDVTYSCRNMTMAAFAEALPGMGGYYFWETSVADRTGLNGAWDFTFRFTPQTALAAVGGDAVKIFDAVDKQLGLKLDLTKIPLPVVVVDSVNEKPTANPPGVTEKVPAPPAAFEVADIKPSDPNSIQMNSTFEAAVFGLAGGRVNIHSLTLKQLIAGAWNVNPDRVTGGPSFVETAHFAVIAKAPSDGRLDVDSMRLLMQGLLADRFRLAVHNEDQPVSAYVLTAVKPKLTKADPSNRSECQNVPATSPGLRTRLITCQNTTMAKLPEVLLRFAPGYFRGIPVVDATGIDGAFDFTLNFSPANAVQGTGADRLPGDVPVASDPNGALSIFDAFEQQLGLKLAMQRRPMPVLVIDHVEQKPTDN
jgi:uncharacterized protein (TIGR03435 family)